MSEKIIFICTRFTLACQMFTFLPVSKVRTNKFYIFRQCTYVVFVYNILTYHPNLYHYYLLTKLTHINQLEN